MSIGIVEVPIGTCHVPFGILQVPIGTLGCSAQFFLLVQFGLFFRHFLSQELYLDVFKLVFIIKS